MWTPFKKQREIRINSRYYLFIQDKWAKKMSSITSKLARRNLILWLVLFIVFTGFISIYNVWKGFVKADFNVVKTYVVSRPVNANNKSLLKKPSQIVLSKKDYEKIMCFRLYMDSIKQTHQGKKIYDSINYYRPGLLDSLYFVEEYYKTHSKN